MSKVKKWKRKINTYYSGLQPQKFISDLETSGFKVRDMRERKSPPPESLLAYREVAAGMEPSETLISKDGSLGFILK